MIEEDKHRLDVVQAWDLAVTKWLAAKIVIQNSKQPIPNNRYVSRRFEISSMRSTRL